MELAELKRISFSNPQFADFLDWNSYPQCPGFKSLHRHQFLLCLSLVSL
jgi:hypothetical protein